MSASLFPLTAHTVLFDLDGTLVDTAADLGYAANLVRIEAGLSSLPLADYRPHASGGARALLGLALGIGVDHPDYPGHKQRFLDHYRANLSRHSCLFPGVDALLTRLESARVPWGIVTNKARALTEPLVAALGLDRRAACVVAGDDSPHPKPAPDNLLLALQKLDAQAEHAIYVGDDQRDVDAARAAGMRAVAAAWGYIGTGSAIDDWNADLIVDSAADLDALLQLPCTAA